MFTVLPILKNMPGSRTNFLSYDRLDAKRRISIGKIPSILLISIDDLLWALFQKIHSWLTANWLVANQFKIKLENLSISIHSPTCLIQFTVICFRDHFCQAGNECSIAKTAVQGSVFVAVVLLPVEVWAPRRSFLLSRSFVTAEDVLTVQV